MSHRDRSGECQSANCDTSDSLLSYMWQRDSLFCQMSRDTSLVNQ